MIPLFTTSQIRELDDYAYKSLGVHGSVLMENAAVGIISALDKKFDLQNNKFSFGIACGKGNNGGDGYTVARHLSNLGHQVKVISIGAEKDLSDDCKLNFNILTKLSQRRKNIHIKKFNSIKDFKFISQCDIIIDALLGTGVSGKLKAPYSDMIKKLNTLKSFRVALDIPTGLNADTGFGEIIFNADMTVTLGDYKRGLFIGNGAEFAGEVILKEIGIGRDYLNNSVVKDYFIEPEDIAALIPKKRKSLHKYSAGKVFVIAGSGKFPGAAVLTSQAALKSGSGAVVLAVPESVRKIIQKNLTEIVFQTYQSDENYLTETSIKTINEKINWADAIAIGPGLDRDVNTIKAVKRLLTLRKSKPVIIDADAIYAIGKGEYKKYNLKHSVLTPHIAEFSQLLNIPVEKINEDVLSYGKGFSVQTDSYLVLKGAPTIIFTPKGEALINSAGNPGMAKFGTGDVLTGMISSFISQVKDIENGVLLGVYLHSLAADLLLEEKTEFSINASDIIHNIPEAIDFIRKSFIEFS